MVIYSTAYCATHVAAACFFEFTACTASTAAACFHCFMVRAAATAKHAKAAMIICCLLLAVACV